MTKQLRIFLFQSPQVLYDAKPLPLKIPPKATPLWAYLLLHVGQPTPRRALAFALWPDAPEETALANLRRHLHHLKAALPASPTVPWLLTDAQTVQWNPEADFWCDAREFQRLIQEPEGLEEAVSLYRGDLLESCYDELILRDRERLREQYLTALGALVEQHRARRAYPQAIALGNRLLAADPMSEDTVRLLMALHHEAGDRAAALQAYTTFRRRLHEELQVDPMPETQALAEAIRRDSQTGEQPEGARAGRKGGQSPPLQETAPPRRRGLALPFVGRRAELSQLLEHWSRAAQGKGSLVMIGGEAGVGKTRLAEEFAHEVTRQGGRVLVGYSLPHAGTPYGPFVDALRSALPLLAALDLPPFWQAVVAQLLPELPARRSPHAPPLPPLPALDPERERLRLFEGLVRCLAGLSRPRPLVLLLEDLHWAGAGVAELLAFLARRTTNLPTLLVGSYRPEDLPPNHPLAAVRRLLQEERLWHALALGPLSEGAVQTLVGLLFDREGRRTDLADRLFALSDGNPLFLREILQDLQEEGAAPEGTETLLLPVVPAAAGAQGIRQLIAARLQRASSPARTLAEIAATCGPAFSFELLWRASGWSEREVLDSLDELMDAQVIRDAGGGGGFDYAFNHQLVQTAIYEASAAVQRKRRHRRLAGLLAADHSGAAAEIARHYELGGDPEQAARFYLQAAEQALALHAGDEARRFLEQGLALTVDGELRWQLLRPLEEILHRQGERSRQIALLNEMAALAEQSGSPDRECQVMRRRILHHRVVGERRAEGEWIQTLKDRAHACGSLPWQAEAGRQEAIYLAQVGRYGDALSVLERVLPVYEALSDAVGQIACLCQQAEIAVHQSRFAAAEAHLQRATALAQVTGDQGTLVQTLHTAAVAAFARQHYAESQRLSQQLLAVSREIGDREGEADGHQRLALVTARLFRVEEAQEHFRQAGDLYGQVGKRQGQAAVSLNAGILAVNLGRYEDGLASFRRAAELFQDLGDPRGVAVSAVNQSAAAIYLEDWPAAERMAQRAQTLAHELGLAFLEASALGNLGEIALRQGKPDLAADFLRRSLALRQETGQGPGGGATDLSLLALALLQLGDEEAARRTADELISLCDSTPDTVNYPQQALWAAAQVHRRVGDTARSEELLARAWEVMQTRAAALPDAESRAAFLCIPFHREIQAAREHDRWPAPSPC